MAPELSRIKEIERRQVKTALLLKLIGRPSYFDAKDRKQSPAEVAELDDQIREFLVRHVETLQGVHPMDHALRTNRADDQPRETPPTTETGAEAPAPSPRKRPVPAPTVVDDAAVDSLLEGVRGQLSDEVAGAIDAGLPDDKRKRIAQFLVINGFAPAGNVRSAPGQKPPVSKNGLEYANIAALNEHSGQVSLSRNEAADLLSGRDTGTNFIDINLPSE